MTDTTTTEEFHDVFAYTTDSILQGLYNFSDTCIFLVLGFSLVLHIIFLKGWFDARITNEVLLEMIQSSQSNNKYLPTGFIPLKKI